MSPSRRPLLLQEVTMSLSDSTVAPQPGMWERDSVVIALVGTPALTPAYAPADPADTIRSEDIVDDPRVTRVNRRPRSLRFPGDHLR
jgi:hypothetical protein